MTTAAATQSGVAASASQPAKIIARAVTKVYPSARGPVIGLRDFDLEVAAGEFVAIVGPSGCGKSTFLRILAGLTPATRGSVSIRADRSSAGALARPLNAMVFQEYALFPWKNVRDNVAFGLEMRGVGRRDRQVVADEFIAKVGLSRFRFAYPHQLSGGMKQRVSIARAFATDPETLLMDEPLGALDAQTRILLQEELLRIWEQSGKTVVYITHNIEEALLLADRVEIMTAHPGANKCAFRVDFPRPRSLDLRGDPEFTRLSLEIWAALRDEARRADAADRGA